MATQRYYLAIKAHADMQPKLEENNLKLLHMKEPLGCWREWSVLTYNHNVIGEILMKENKFLQKKIDDYEKKLKILTTPSMYCPHMYCGCPTAQLSSAEVELRVARSSEELEVEI
ncbi:hypothetical protein EUGRSUZ_C03163 [Eucalyptus grandis]|uniref:Uncharacterized protein n=2 Tax=Eucalyptus grandis TaxID=71139 RepID=A0ACC3LHM2_EUCGR|nr:hypothetical protein EUGRSUZ_C03163 [Eucalyptus grandis]